MVVTTTIISSSRPSAAILIISSRSIRGRCVLLTQGPRIDHLSSDAELKIGSHLAVVVVRRLTVIAVLPSADGRRFAPTVPHLR
jgi:hypothetical protein